MVLRYFEDLTVEATAKALSAGRRRRFRRRSWQAAGGFALATGTLVTVPALVIDGRSELTPTVHLAAARRPRHPVRVPSAACRCGLWPAQTSARWNLRTGDVTRLTSNGPGDAVNSSGVVVAGGSVIRYGRSLELASPAASTRSRPLSPTPASWSAGHGPTTR